VSDTLQRELRIDVSDVVDLPGPLETAVTVHLPPPGTELCSPPVVAFGFPGGGYSRGYWDIDDPAFPGYSQAAHHVGRGWIFVACDHLGVGGSSLPDPAALTFESLAAANHATVGRVLDRLRDGSVDGRLDAVGEAPLLVGMGQSMGGGLLIVQQGRHATFDAVAILGFSALHTVIPAVDGDDSGLHDTARGVGSVTMADYVAAARPGLFRVFHWDDVPDHFVDADLSDIPRVAGRNPAWGSVTAPNVCFTMTSEGCVGPEAAAISVPVFVGCGQRDVVPSPRTEPTGYPASPDITVFVVTRMAHMHNFASTRQQLWRRLHGWVTALAAGRS